MNNPFVLVQWQSNTMRETALDVFLLLEDGLIKSASVCGV